MTTAKLHLPFIDGLRGIATLAVFLFHANGAAFDRWEFGWDGWFRDYSVAAPFLVSFPLTYGWCGVPIFFVISGFCIHLSHQKSPRDGWSGFWQRRFWRIYPPYLVAVIVFFFLWPPGNFSGMGDLSRQRQLWSHLSLVHNLDARTFSGINASFWSIAVEAQLYLVYPLLVGLVAIIGWRNSLVLAFVLEVCGNYSGPLGKMVFGVQTPFLISHSPLSYCASWSLGAYLAQCYLDKRSSHLSRIRFDVAVLIALAVPLFKPTDPLRFFAFALATAVAMDRLISGAWTLPKGRAFQWGWRHLTFLGVVSYSFYLYNQPIVHLTDDVTAAILSGYELPALVKFLAVVAWYPVILLLSYASFVLIEMPAARWGKKLQAKVVHGLSGESP